tara:strand:+ start:1550 stop:2614 length:1065 start_codon:yes stop_codon:yes gene_type:complete
MALASHTPATWNDILSTTMHNYHKTLTDNIFDSRPLLNHYMSNGRVKTISGGISIVEPVMYAEGDAGSYAEWDTLTVTPKPTASAAQFEWKQLFATIAISGLEEAQNNGKEQIINLLEAKIMQAEDTLKTRLNGMLFGTFAGTTPANDFLGLPTVVGNADTDAIGGIVTGTGVNDWWKSQVNSTGGAFDGAALEDALRALYNATSDAGPDVVDAIFTNAFGFGLYESSLTPQVRYTDTKKANLGFQNLMFKNVPMMWDFQCSGGTEGTVSDTSASFYGLNSKYVGLKLHADRNFSQSPFTDNLSGSLGAPASGAGIGSASGNALDARVSFITTFGNHVTRNRRRLFKLLNVTAA